MKAFLSYFGNIYLGVTGSEASLTAFARQLNAVFVSQRKVRRMNGIPSATPVAWHSSIGRPVCSHVERAG